MFLLILSMQLCLAALSSAAILAILEFETIADVIHRCVDVALLMESHLARVTSLRTHIIPHHHHHQKLHAHDSDV